MWIKFFRLFLIALFVWATVLGFKSGSWEIVIIPFLAMGALLLAQTKLRKVYPEFGSQLATSLMTLIVIYNICITIPSFRTWLISELPRTAEETTRLKREGDLRTAEELDRATAELLAREALHKYLLRKEDIVGKQIQDKLDTLNAKRQKGTFGPDDEKAERETLEQYEKLVMERRELQQIIDGIAPDAAPSRKNGGEAAGGGPQPALFRKNVGSMPPVSERKPGMPISATSPSPNPPVQLATVEPVPANTSASQNTTPARQAISTPVSNFDSGYFHLALWRCARNGSQAHCSGKAEISADAPTPNGTDGTVILVFHRFGISDENAAQYSVSAGSFGDARCMGTGYCPQRITPGIPVSFSFIVDHLAPTSNTLNLIMPNNQGENAVFRAVPIQ